MICPVCKSENETSNVTPSPYTMSTLLGYSPGYHDKTGAWVANPDPNWKTTAYWCSRGHTFDIVRKEGAPDRVRVAGAGSGPTFDHPDDAKYVVANESLAPPSSIPEKP